LAFSWFLPPAPKIGLPLKANLTMGDTRFFVSMLLLVEPGKARFWMTRDRRRRMRALFVRCRGARPSDLFEQGQQAVIGVWRQGR
jgi:hypothetical protein